MLIQVLLLCAGLTLLLVAGDVLVRGAVSAALKVGVPPLIAGIVVVGFGTSLPEVLVSVEGALRNAEDLAHGNIVGSNIANILLVLAVPCLIAPVLTNARGLSRSMTMTLIVSAAWIVITLFFGLNPYIGAAFLAVLSAYIYFLVQSARRDFAAGRDVDVEDVDEGDAALPQWKMLGFIAAGLVGLWIGAQLTIGSGTKIATALGVSEALIGLTLLAVGTSLPEIGAALAAAMRKHGDVALGNVVGSNMFNVLAAGGSVALVKPQVLDAGFHTYSHWVMALATLVLAYFIYAKQPMGRLVGVALLAGYILYIVGLTANVNFPDSLGLSK